MLWVCLGFIVFLTSLANATPCETIVPIETNQKFFNSICECLLESPQTGDCGTFGHVQRDLNGGVYGTMPYWLTRDVTSMQRAFDLERLMASAPNGCGLNESSALTFNAQLKYWDTSHVTNFDYMFNKAANFEGDGLQFWETGDAETMRGMFAETIKFDAKISFWDLRNVIDTSLMFYKTIKFNQPLASWNVETVELAFAMFQGAQRFNQDISQWHWTSIWSGSNPSNGCKKKRKMLRRRQLLQDVGETAVDENKLQRYQDYAARLCGEQNGLKQMFQNAPRFNGDVSTWTGEATRYEQENFVEGADSFNAKWKCKTEFDGAPETCKLRVIYNELEEISDIRQFFRSD